MQPAVSTVDVIRLLDERAAFLRANLEAGCRPDLHQMAAFLGTLANQTATWANMPTTAPEQRGGLLRMFASLHWDCVSNAPAANRAPPLPAAVLDALMRQRWELDWALKRQPAQHQHQPWQLRGDRAGPARKRRRSRSPPRNVRRGTPPVFGGSAQRGSPAVLLVFDLNGTVLTRRRGGGNQAASSSTPRTVLVNGKPMMLRPHLGALMDTIATSRQQRSESSASCSLTAAVWTSAMEHNMLPMVSAAFGTSAALGLRFAANRDHCTPLSVVQAQQRQEGLVELTAVTDDPRSRHHGTVKDLERMWEQHPAFDATTTVLIDDSERKAALQPRNLLLLPSFDEEPRSSSGGPSGEDGGETHCDSDDDVLLGLSAYLGDLQAAMTAAFNSADRATEPPDVRRFLAENLFAAWLVRWRRRRREKQECRAEHAASEPSVSPLAKTTVSSDVPLGATPASADSTGHSDKVAARLDSSRLAELLGGAQPKNRAERRALDKQSRAHLCALVDRAQTSEHQCQGGNGTDTLAVPVLQEDVSTRRDNEDGGSSSASSISAEEVCDNGTQQTKKKPRWTKEQKLSRQRQPRDQQQAEAEAAEAGSLSDGTATAAVSLLSSSTPGPGPSAAANQLPPWGGPVFCNPFEEVARAVGVLPPSPTAASAERSVRAVVSEVSTESDVCNISIQQLCQLPQMVACKLQANLIRQVVTALSHERIRLSKDGQHVLVAGTSKGHRVSRND